MRSVLPHQPIYFTNSKLYQTIHTLSNTQSHTDTFAHSHPDTHANTHRLTDTNSHPVTHTATTSHTQTHKPIKTHRQTHTHARVKLTNTGTCTYTMRDRFVNLHSNNRSRVSRNVSSIIIYYDFSSRLSLCVVLCVSQYGCVCLLVSLSVCGTFVCV